MSSDPSPPLHLGQRIAKRAQSVAQWVRSVSVFVKVVLVAGGALLSGLAKYLPVPTTPFDYHFLLGVAGASTAFLGAVALIFLDKNLAGALVDAADAAADLQSAQADAGLLARQFEQAEARDN